MVNPTIVKTIRELGSSLGLKSLQLKGNKVEIDAAEFVSYALNAASHGNGTEEDEDEDGEGVPPAVVREVLGSLGGKGTSSEIRSKLKEEHGISASAADLRPVLQALVESGEVAKSGEARAKVYSMKKKK